MSRTANDIETLERKLGKRGFRRDPRPSPCPSCGERAQYHYALKHTNLGGRVVEWCHACQNERSFTRPDGDTLVEDVGFAIESFVA